jgi:aminoglycoside phosphotransferase (APT) family kinase protein
MLAAMGVAEQRDLEAVRRDLPRGLGGAAITDLEPAASGFSSDTYLFCATGERLVARFPPAGDALFPEYDLAREAALLGVIASTVAVPRVVAVVEDPPFLVVTRAEGYVPADNYLNGGRLHDASPAEQRAARDAFVDALARVHRAALPDVGLRRGLAAELGWWRDYARWAGGDAVADQIDELARTAPTPEPPPSLCWGDPRLPNMVFDDAYAPVALLDWEMSTIAPAEVDVGWFVAIHRQSVAFAHGDLPGFRPLADALARYEQQLGRSVEHLDWYEAFAELRIKAIMFRMATAMRKSQAPTSDAS